MPLITIQAIAPTDLTLIPHLIASVRDEGAKALNCATDNVWVIFRGIPPGHYVQGDTPALSPQKETHPVIVTVQANIGRTIEERETLVAAIASQVGRGLSIPAENIWIHYQEMRPEDIWFRGKWVDHLTSGRSDTGLAPR